MLLQTRAFLFQLFQVFSELGKFFRQGLQLTLILQKLTLDLLEVGVSLILRVGLLL